MKKRILILTALTLLVVGVLCGCGCSKESKFTGTWEEKIDEEKLKVEEEKQAEVAYGKAETEYDKKLLGKWETDDKIRNFTINKRNGIVEIPGVPYFTIVDENGNEIYAKKATGKTYMPEYNYVYDTKNNTLTIQERQVGAFSESTKTLVYKKAQAKSPKDNFKPDKLVLNSNKTGTITENDYGPTEIVWAMTSDGNPNTIVVRANSALSKDLIFTFDPEKDTLRKGSEDNIYYFERTK